MANRPILLVHGAWNGAWCWSALHAGLDARGVASWAVDLPGDGISTEPLGEPETEHSPFMSMPAETADVLAGVATR